MRMKQWIAGAAVFALTAFLFLPNSVQAQEQPPAKSSSATMITTRVPDTHSAELSITGEGTVTVAGNTYTETTEIQIPRLEEVTWQFDPADGYRLKEVIYNGTDVTEELSGNTYTAQPVNEDGTEIRVVFVEGIGGTGDTSGDAGGTGSGSGGNGQSGTGSTTGTPGTGSTTGTSGTDSTSGTSGADSPKTGDETEISFFMTLMSLSGIGAVMIILSMRRKRA